MPILRGMNQDTKTASILFYVKNRAQKTNTKREQAQSNRIKVLNSYLSNILGSKDRKQASVNIQNERLNFYPYEYLIPGPPTSYQKLLISITEMISKKEHR